ncbi:MAG: sigma 54-interacting transcriptional regulator [Chloroflexi bacterium]|nr:sigma 54-interacting transcriptional regulator [Chloroflexota bacterium]
MTKKSNLKLAWKEFLEHQIINDTVPAWIANSWQRSRTRINLKQPLKLTRLSPEHFLATQISNFDMISVARPIMEDIYQYIENSDTVLLLVNSAGYVLDLLGDREIIARLNKLGIDQSVLLSEDHIGTNAFGLALTEQMPIQVIGAQHYRPEFHGLAAVAAPFFDLSGRAIGVLGLFTSPKHYHQHSLGLISAAARAIEGQKQSDSFLAELNSQLNQLNTILSLITDGIAVWNAENTLIHVNPSAVHILGQPAQSFVGKHFDQLFALPTFLAEAFRRHEEVNDVEIAITLTNKTIDCIVSLFFVFNKKNEMQWGILTIKPEKNIRKLVQRQVGASAILTLDDIPGDSTQIQRVRNFVNSAANAEASIFIRGEVGTGKNALASAIHNASRRHDGPFVIFSCSSIPNELIINELLGYDNTNGPALQGSRPSKFELAKMGTIFFQDVDALPLEAQSVLLNALELGFVQRLGSQRAIDVDIRVIASTSARMETLLAQGSFRPDLYYRLSTFAITIPPLRERSRDIPMTVDRILRRLSRQLSHPLVLGEGVLDVLKRYPWPGNVREIESVLGRAATQASADGVIDFAHIPSALRFVHQVNPGEHIIPNIQTLSEVQRETIIRTAQICRGNVTRMALALGISRTTLWRHLKEFDLQVDDYR